MFQKISPLKTAAFITCLAAFVSLCLFVNAQMEKYNYFFYLYGDSAAAGSKALVKVLSRDGELVFSPEIFVNGVRQPSQLIDLRPDLREIKVVFGKTEVVFPLKFSDITASRFVPQPPLGISLQEAKNVRMPLDFDGRKIYLLPENFRAVSEFETAVGLFCTKNGKPCEDPSLFLNGERQELNNGFMKFSAVFGKDQGVEISFENGESEFVPLPYPGKMFKFTKIGKSLALSSLSSVRTAHVDCFSQGKWVGTDVISVNYEGITLPEVYSKCDTVQASMNSASPGTMFAVYSKSDKIFGKINDPYYSTLAPVLPEFSEKARRFFVTSYNSLIFQPLSKIFSGEKLEQDFIAAKKSELSVYRTILIISSILGMIIFGYSMLKKIKVVVDEEGELISNSLAKQRAMVFGALAFYALFIFALIYLLDHLA